MSTILWMPNAASTPGALIFDHINGIAGTTDEWLRQLTELYDRPEPPGPLSRAQFSLWKRKRGTWLGNRMSDARYWLWRLTR
jgi:hypothetical protein